MEKILYGVIAGLIALAIYAGGQMTAFLPGPEYFFWGSLVSLGLLIFGYICGKRKTTTKVPQKKASSSQGEHTSK